MFVRRKPNKSGLVSVQVIDKRTGSYKVIKTIGSSSDHDEIERLVNQANRYIQTQQGSQEIDFSDHRSLYSEVLSSVRSLRLVGVEFVLGRIFDEIGFRAVEDPLFRDLVLYRLVYPRSKLKTIQYLFRYENKSYTEDDVYRYMDKLYDKQKELVQQISYRHTLDILSGRIHAVFYDVTTLYFEIEQEDELRKPGFSKEGKHQNPQILLGLLVSKDAYPLAYDIFEGKKFEGDTLLPVLDAFRERYGIEKVTVVADAGLLSKANVEGLRARGYEFILGARIKNERTETRNRILGLNLRNGESRSIHKGDDRLIITYSEDRARKDRYNRERGIAKLEKRIGSDSLTKSSINNKGYNKFLSLEGDLIVSIDRQKAEEDAQWDGLKGYLTNSPLDDREILENYAHLWQIEKAFRVAKGELRIRPVFHYKRRRIEAHICLNFVAYKVYKELERRLKEWKTEISAETVIEIIQNIYEISVVTPNNELIKKTLILTEEQRIIQRLFNF